MRIARLALISLLALAPAASIALTVKTITIDTPKGPHAFKVEMAEDHASQEKGLMFRKTMAADAGMLFDFHQDVMTSFWMKNTVLPLDIVFIRSDGAISSIAANAVPYSLAPIPSSEPVRAVLELNAGRAKALGLEPGSKVHSAIFGNGR